MQFIRRSSNTLLTIAWSAFLGGFIEFYYAKPTDATVPFALVLIVTLSLILALAMRFVYTIERIDEKKDPF